jgi:hypothetical protein
MACFTWPSCGDVVARPFALRPKALRLLRNLWTNNAQSPQIVRLPAECLDRLQDRLGRKSEQARIGVA